MKPSLPSRQNDYFLALLLDARKRSRLTQRELATRLGKPQSFVSKYETGERRLDVLEFERVADALGINIAAFFRQLKGRRR